jgi:hypothetical protein
LIAHGFQGRPGEVVPEMSDEWVQEIGERYISLYESITGQRFMRAEHGGFTGENRAQTIKCLNALGYH